MLVSTLIHAPGVRSVQLALLHMQVRSLSGCCHHNIIHPSLGGDWSSYWALDFWCPGPMIRTGSLTAGYTLHLRPGPPNPLLIWHSLPN